MTMHGGDTSLPGPLVLVVGIALDTTDDVVWDETQRFALHGEPSVVHVCHVLEPSSRGLRTVHDDVPDTIQNLRERSLREFVEGRLAQDRPRFLGSIWIHVLHGHPADRLAQLAASRQADAIVVGSAGSKGLRSIEPDSTSLSLFNSSPCSVVLARLKDTASTRRPFRASGRSVATVPGWIQ